MCPGRIRAEPRDHAAGGAGTARGEDAKAALGACRYAPAPCGGFKAKRGKACTPTCERSRSFRGEPGTPVPPVAWSRLRMPGGSAAYDCVADDWRATLYVSDGIELSDTEFRLLRDLVDAEKSGTLKAYVNNDLWGNAPIHLAPVEDREPVYHSLGDKGLLSGKASYGMFVPSGLTYLGRDWVSDYYRAQKSEEERAREERRHDYLVAIAGAGFGILLGAWIEAVTGVTRALLGLL